MNHEDCKDLFEAGKTLMERSGLAKFSGQRFIACHDQQSFEQYWAEKFDPEYGRYMAWILFLVGAENLAKAACVCNGIVIPTNATLDNYTKKKGYIQTLCQNTGHCGGIKCALQRGIKRLKDVRNRDVHSYRRNKRSADFPAVEATFVPAANLLVEAMEHSRHQF